MAKKVIRGRKVTFSDGTVYRSNNGTLRRDPPKLGGRERKALRRKQRKLAAAVFGHGIK